ncbi:hypothetical protein GWK47_044706 [Chionoecetes opilio]|uniref:Uncharacterized protein n=1 Tax=Chionoecetes opilio TaxID=41210 RepID=A0A8J4Y6Z1_CHIOP|nr:hypothetical protein GWK47_044706 [Chionoecetes opilio]
MQYHPYYGRCKTVFCDVRILSLAHAATWCSLRRTCSRCRKNRCVRSLAEDVEGHLNANDLRPAYRALKKLRSKSPSRASAIRTADGRLVSDMDWQDGRWAEYFGQLFTVDPPTEQLHTTGLQAVDADPPIDETAPSLDEGDSTGGDRGQAVWLQQRLKVTHTLHLHLKHHGESHNVTSVLEGVEMWLLSGIAVFNDPHRSVLYLVHEGEVFIGRAAPREARVLQGGAYLRFVEDFQPPTVEKPRHPPQRCQLPSGHSAKPLNMGSEGQPTVVDDHQYLHLGMRCQCVPVEVKAQSCTRPCDIC